MNYLRRLFGLKQKVVNENEDIHFDDIIDDVIIEKKTSVVKRCSYCRNETHKINNCQLVNDMMSEITSRVTNNKDIPSVRDYLRGIDKKIILRYVSKRGLRRYMYQNCSVYYDSHISKSRESEIELIIGYLCVLPYHPEILIERKYKKSIKESYDDGKRNKNDNFIFMSVGSNGLGLGFRLI